MSFRVAVFTNEFPSRVSTFFARDMRSLLDAGFEVDIFPLYPLDEALWRYVPDCLNEAFLPRSRVHHAGAWHTVRALGGRSLRETARFARDCAAVEAAASRFGVPCVAKSAYAAAKAWSWAGSSRVRFDHVLSYWGNYAATAAYLFQRASDRTMPFSTFVHAGIDLYRDQAYLKEKLLHADNIVMVCQFNREFLRERYEDVFDRLVVKMHFHHLGLDLSEYPYHEAGARHASRVVGVGSFSKLKGYEYLVGAIADLRRRNVPCELELVGDGPETPRLKRLAAQLGIEQDVVFRGWLEPQDVQRTIASASVLVHPSTGLGDAVPTVIKEAMALGTPVVASSVAGIPELLDGGRCGTLVEPSSASQIADALQALLGDARLRHDISVRARAYAERTFDQTINGRALAEVLRSTARTTVH